MSRLLAIGAHAADFVWRAGGALALAAEGDGVASVLALSYGERGESGELWKQPDQTVENVKRIRHGEAERAAEALGAEFRCLDLGDYPLEVDRAAVARIVDVIRELAPDTIVTHTDRDPFNPDHPAAFAAVERARALASGAGVASAFETVPPPQLLLFEPHQPELCNFTPTTFLDITPVIERKRAAMAEMKAQSYLQTYYAQRAEQRGDSPLLGLGGEQLAGQRHRLRLRHRQHEHLARLRAVHDRVDHQVVALGAAHGPGRPAGPRSGDHPDEVEIEQPPAPGRLVDGGRAEPAELLVEIHSSATTCGSTR